MLPVLLVPVVALIGLALIGAPATWLTLTAAGLAMGMMIFLMASGLTIVFGLMDVINFGHGAFIAVGAFIGVTVLARLAGWTEAAPRWRSTSRHWRQRCWWRWPRPGRSAGCSSG